MKLTATLYRTTHVNTKDLITIAGFDVKVGVSVAVADSKGIYGQSCYLMPDGNPLVEKRLRDALRDKFAPFANRFKIFFPPVLQAQRTLVGMEAMAFDVLEAGQPQLGLVHFDPVETEDVHRMDGALQSELNRMGLGAEYEDFDWRMAYDLKGN